MERKGKKRKTSAKGKEKRTENKSLLSTVVSSINPPPFL